MGWVSRLAWATKITSGEQVEYRLEGACGCDADHQVDVDAQVEYRLKDDLVAHLI